MELQKTEGIVLKSIPYKDYDQIITIFSEDRGLITLFAKGSLGKGKGLSPLARAEFIYQQGRTDLLMCRDLAILDQHPRLRNTLPRLETACELIQIVNTTQCPGKPAPLLYQLLTRCLGWIPDVNAPEVIGASFRLKLLRHEGLLGTTETCAQCQSSLTQGFFLKGEIFCPTHSPAGSIELSEEECKYFFVFAHCRSIQELKTLNPPEIVIRKIKSSFEEIFSLA